jgi:hypothetical protein
VTSVANDHLFMNPSASAVPWGDVPAWVALGLTVLGMLVGGLWAMRSDRRTRHAEEGAEEARAGAASLEVSLQSIAETLAAIEAARRADRTAAAEPQDAVSIRVGNAVAPANGVPRFNLEYVRGRAYRLRNVGGMTATGVTIDPTRLPIVANRLPRDVTLEPFRSTETFILQGAMQAPLPAEILVRCNELNEAVVLPIP